MVLWRSPGCPDGMGTNTNTEEETMKRGSKYGKHKNPRETTPFVCIYARTRIRLNKPCVEYLGSVEYVLVLIDQSKFLSEFSIQDKIRIPAVLSDGMVQFPF